MEPGWGDRSVRRRGDLRRLADVQWDLVVFSEISALNYGLQPALNGRSPTVKIMAYSQFDIEKAKTELNISVVESPHFFANIAAIPSSSYLRETLDFNTSIALAINSEKSRSEMIIAPILWELKRLNPDRVSIFSGKEFSVDIEKGLTGFCDFMVSQSSQQLLISAPVITIVEAKNENIELGLGQCMAEMVAAQIFNQRKNNIISSILGVVTTGSNWKFMQLKGDIVTVDMTEYFLSQVEKIVGILNVGLAI